MKFTTAAVFFTAAIAPSFAAPAVEELVVREPNALEERGSNTNYICAGT